jgi:3-oxoacyl-[acyl-carrier-protein] synthase II
VSTNSDSRSAVWITGVGAATPLGHTFEQFADQLLAGKSGVEFVTDFNVADHPSQIAGRIGPVACAEGLDDPAIIKAFSAGRHSSFSELKKLEQLVLWSCAGALRDSGWWERRSEVRVGVILGMGAENPILWEGDFLNGGDAIYHPERDDAPTVERLRRSLNLCGPTTSVSAACASGNYALAQARHWLQLGWVDVCLAGACDAAVTPMSLAGFGNLRALSRRNAEPKAASRPFDRGRDGFVMGEGGAVFLLESETTARKRGARAYAEVAGFGATSDAHHMVIPSPDPSPAAAAMRQALNDARVNPSEVGYVNAHATSTPVGDVAESRVLHAVLGDHVRRTPVSSTKSMTGHLLTAAAAAEALACVVAMDRRAVPPTINLVDPDPECDLCHVPNEARPANVRVAVSNSFGFGGSNTCLVLKAV